MDSLIIAFIVLSSFKEGTPRKYPYVITNVTVVNKTINYCNRYDACDTTKLVSK